MNGSKNETRRSAEPPDSRVWLPSVDAKRFVSNVLAKAEMEIAGEWAQMLGKMQFFEGFECLKSLPAHGATFFYLPKGGIGIDIHKAASRCELPFFLRFFSEEQLSDGEMHSIMDVRNQVYQEFPPNERCGGPAFLGWEGDPASENALLKWMCSVLQLVAAQSIQEKAQCEHRYLEEFAKVVASRFTVSSIGDDSLGIGNMFALASMGRSWIRHSVECRQLVDNSMRRYGELSQQRSAIALEEYQRNIRKDNPEARVARWPLGQQYEGLLNRLDSLVRELLASQSSALQGLGVRLESLLDSKPPTLAVVGAFSSGKTTLLNNVLLGERPGCAFRTRHTANTAIVYEIVSCGSDEVESVEFALCEKVEHPLFDVEGDGETWGKYRKMLLELLDAGILQTPEICFETASDAFYYREPKARTFLENRDPVDARRKVEIERYHRPRTNISRSGSAVGEDHPERNRIRRIVFRASVTENDQLLARRLEQLGLSRKMSLASAEDWKRFQGVDNDASNNPAEMDLVSILVKKAVVRLNSQLLRLTAIADTPGTGSSRDRHDYISEQYIDHSEAFILLLRTGGDQYSKRVVSILRRIARKYASDASAALPRVAFVINADHKTAAQLANIDDYLKLAAAEFGLTKDDFNRRAKVFAIDLKNTESCGCTLLGYPSLAALSNWVSSEVFALSAYKDRLTRIREILGEQWDSTTRILEKRLHDGKMSMAEKKKQISQLNRLVHEELPSLQERFLDYIKDPREEMAEIRDRLLQIVDPYTKRAFSEKEDVDRLREAVMASLGGFNRATSEATEVNPAEEWIAEISTHLANVSLLLPGLRPPDKRAVHFESGLQANLERVERRFRKILKEWPNLRRWLWDRVTSIFGGEDIRCHFARKLHETLREEMDRVLDVFDEYHSLCSSFFQDTSEQIETQKNERLRGLSDEVDSAIVSIKLELQTVRSFQKKRARILSELDKFVEGEVCGRAKRKPYGRKGSN